MNKMERKQRYRNLCYLHSLVERMDSVDCLTLEGKGKIIYLHSTEDKLFLSIIKRIVKLYLSITLHKNEYI